MKASVLKALVLSAAGVAAYFNPELLLQIISGAVIVVLTGILDKERK